LREITDHINRDNELTLLSGGVRLCRQLAQERSQHYDSLHAVPVHLRRHRRPAVQGSLLLLHGRHQEHRGRLQVRILDCMISRAAPSARTTRSARVLKNLQQMKIMLIYIHLYSPYNMVAQATQEQEYN